MQKGYNSDHNIKGKNYHVQTEDWGYQNPFLVSRVFCNGAVLKTIKTPYEEALKTGSVNDDDALKQALRRQHYHVVDSIISGQI